MEEEEGSGGIVTKNGHGQENESQRGSRGKLEGSAPCEDRGSLIIRVVWNAHIADVIVIVLWGFFDSADAAAVVPGL